MEKAIEFVLSCMNFDGGFGCRPGSESHAGQVSLLLKRYFIVIVVNGRALLHKESGLGVCAVYTASVLISNALLSIWGVYIWYLNCQL